jgi:hypothetical protein
MALLEELLKSAKAHPQTVIVALIAVIAVGSLAGGLWIHNLQSMLDSRDALREQELALVRQKCDNKEALLKEDFSRLKARLDYLNEAVKHHELFLDGETSELKQLNNQPSSAALNRRIDQIANDLNRSKEQLVNARTVLLSFEEITRTDLTGAAPNAAAPSSAVLLIVLIVLVFLATGITWVGIRLYKRRRLLH